MRTLTALFLFAACGGAPKPAPNAPAPQPAPATNVAAPQPKSPTASDASEAFAPEAPAECRRFVAPLTGCGDERASIEQIGPALAVEDPLARDRELACIETRIASGSAALIRALRAELAPIACADVLAADYFDARAALAHDVPIPEAEFVLMGLGSAARLSRLVTAPPTLAAPFDKARFLTFFEQELKPWMIAQARAIGALSQSAASQHGYAEAVGAVEAALADLRFVRAVRAVPLPAELSADPEVKNVYYAALDEALEPRKARGRDAALVALRTFEKVGVLVDARVDRARELLSELYAGSRVDALDRLLLPELPPLHTASPLHLLAAKLPTFYATALLSDVPNPEDPALLRALLERGIPKPLRDALDTRTLDPDARFLHAFAETRRGILYFSGPAFRRAGELLGPAATGDGALLLQALSRALSAAPKDMAELMLAAPRLRQPLGSFEALEAIAASRQRYRAEAEFDAAYLRALTPPGDDAKFWQDLERRFRRAEQGLKRGPGRAFARELAASAAATANAIRKAQPK